MLNSRLFRLFAALTTLALLICGTQAFAQPYRVILHRAHPAADQNVTNPEAALAPNLYGTMAAFVVTPWTADPGQPYNTDTGADLWPCFGAGTANSDCPTIGDPSQPFPSGGVVVGVPEYVWFADSNSTAGIVGCADQTSVFDYCVQEENFYEDETADTTDDLLWSLTVTQVNSGVTTYIFDSGTQDYGPNAFHLTNLSQYPITAVFYGDLNLGDLGLSGKNNGNCFANSTPTNTPSEPNASYYPLKTASFPNTGPYAPYYAVSANKTCGAVTKGAAAAVTVTLELAKPTYTKHTTASSCKAADGTTIGPPCYTVTYTKKYAESQKFTIFIE